MRSPIKYLLTGILIIIFSITPANATCNTRTIGNNLEMKFTGLAQGMAQQVVINSVPGAGQVWQVVQIAQCFSGGVTVCGMNLAASQLESAAWTEIGNHIGPEATQVLQNVKDICGEAKDVEINKEGEVEIKEGGHIKVDNEETDLSEIWGFEEGKVSGKNVKITSEDIETEEDGYIQVWGEKTDIGKMFGLGEGEISFDNAKITGSKDNPNIKIVETTSVSTMDFKKYGIENVEFSKGTKFTIKTSEKDDGTKDYLIDRIQDEVTNFNGELANFGVTDGKGKIFFIAKGSELASGKTSDQDFLSINEADAIDFIDPLSGVKVKHEYVSNLIYQDTADGINYQFYARKKPLIKGGRFATYKHGSSEITPISENHIISWNSETDILKVTSPEEEDAPLWHWKSLKYDMEWWGSKITGGPAPEIPTIEARKRTSVINPSILEGQKEGIFVRGMADVEYNKESQMPISFEATSGTGWTLTNEGSGDSDLLLIGEDSEKTKVFINREGEVGTRSYEEAVGLAQNHDKPAVVVSVNKERDVTVPKYAAWGKNNFYIATEKTAAEISGDLDGFNGFLEDNEVRYNVGASTNVEIRSAIKDRELKYFAKEAQAEVGVKGQKHIREETPEEINRDLFVARKPNSGFTYDSSPDNIPKQFDDLYGVKNEDGNIIAVTTKNPAEAKIIKDSLVDAQFKSFAGQDPFVKQAGIKPEELSSKNYIQENFAGYNDAQRLKKILINTYNDQLAIAKDENLAVADRQTANLEMAKIKKALLQRDELLVKYSFGK